MNPPINVTVSEKQYQRIKKLVDEGEFRNMAEFVRNCIAAGLKEYNFSNSGVVEERL